MSKSPYNGRVPTDSLCLLSDGFEAMSVLRQGLEYDGALDVDVGKASFGDNVVVNTAATEIVESSNLDLQWWTP